MTALLDLLIDLGLADLSLNRTVDSLSIGERQLLELAYILSKKGRGPSLYLFDEPTRGLHLDDLSRLIPLLLALVDRGNTLVMVDHRLDLIAQADYLIDLGPEAGEEGGAIVAKGRPEEVASNPHSYTARYLKEFLEQKNQKIDKSLVPKEV
jgi:excinuclease ABC subunit A